MKILIITLALLAAQPALANSSDCRSSIRTAGGQIVRVGDAEGSAWSKLGRPDRQLQLENQLGAGIGAAWVYYTERKTTRVEVSGSRVVALCETLH